LSQLCVAFRSETVSFLNKRTGVRVRLTKSWCSRNADRHGHQLVQRLGTTVAKRVKFTPTSPQIHWQARRDHAGAPRGTFTTLVAAIDSFDELIETNELYNVATFTRGEIAVIETTVEALAALALLRQLLLPRCPRKSRPPPAAPSGPAPQDSSDELDLETSMARASS
jgi:hypothetical protein